MKWLDNYSVVWQLISLLSKSRPSVEIQMDSGCMRAIYTLSMHQQNWFFDFKEVVFHKWKEPPSALYSNATLTECYTCAFQPILKYASLILATSLLDSIPYFLGCQYPMQMSVLPWYKQKLLVFFPCLKDFKITTWEDGLGHFKWLLN